MSCEEWSRRAAELRKRLAEAEAQEIGVAVGSHVAKLQSRITRLDLERQLALCERNHWWEAKGSPGSPSDLG